MAEIDISTEMKEDRRIAEEYLLGYTQRLKEYQAEKDEYLSSGPAPSTTGGGKSNLPGAPTESQAIRSAMYDEKHPAYLWLRAVELAVKTLGERKNIFIRVRREADRHNPKGCGGRGRRPWVIFTQRRYAEEIKDRFLNTQWLSEDTTRRWWREIIGRVVEIHLRLSQKD